MASIRPVLLIGTDDYSDLRAALQARGVGVIVATSLEDARSMLRHFCVDAIVAADPVDVRPLLTFAVPVVMVGDQMTTGQNITFAPDTTSLVRLLPELIVGDQSVRGAA